MFQTIAYRNGWLQVTTTATHETVSAWLNGHKLGTFGTIRAAKAAINRANA